MLASVLVMRDVPVWVVDRIESLPNHVLQSLESAMELETIHLPGSGDYGIHRVLQCTSLVHQVLLVSY